jgi:hypothetical protein
VVDLTEVAPQGPRPQEILALQYEYFNMTAWKQAYELLWRVRSLAIYTRATDDMQDGGVEPISEAFSYRVVDKASRQPC